MDTLVRGLARDECHVIGTSRDTSHDPPSPWLGPLPPFWGDPMTNDDMYKSPKAVPAYRRTFGLKRNKTKTDSA